MFAATLGTRRDSADIQVSRLWTKPSIRNSSVQDSSFEDLLRGHTPLKQQHSRGTGAGACPPFAYWSWKSAMASMASWKWPRTSSAAAERPEAQVAQREALAGAVGAVRISQAERNANQVVLCLLITMQALQAVVATLVADQEDRARRTRWLRLQVLNDALGRRAAVTSVERWHR